MKGLSNIKSHLIALAAIAFLFSHCKGKEDKPAHVLSQEQMVRTLTEIYIAEEKVVRLTLPPDSAAAVFEGLRQRVFDDLAIPDSVFKSSLDYYMTKPLEMEKIYATLVDSLQLREQRAPYQQPAVQ